MTWEIVKAFIGFGVAAFFVIWIWRTIENNADNWRRLDSIEKKIDELMKKDQENVPKE